MLTVCATKVLEEVSVILRIVVELQHLLEPLLSHKGITPASLNIVLLKPGPDNINQVCLISNKK